MVYFSQEFIIPCHYKKFYQEIIQTLPQFIQNHADSIIDECTIISSQDNKRTLILKKKNILMYIPKSVLNLVSKNFLETITIWKENNIFDDETQTIKWASEPNDSSLSIYSLQGKTVIKPSLQENECIAYIEFDFVLSFDLKNNVLKYFIHQILEKRIPMIIFNQTKQIYVSFAKYLNSA
jgi:hypothetical protein